MHELSIAQNLIELASQSAEAEGATRVSQLKLRIGLLAGVVEEALRFSFELAAEGTLCAGAALAIDLVPLTVRCPQCEAPQSLGNSFRFLCPVCGAPTAEILSGQELDLVSIELEFDEVPARDAQSA